MITFAYKHQFCLLLQYHGEADEVVLYNYAKRVQGLLKGKFDLNQLV